MENKNFILTDHEIRELCIAGGMAPSGGNAQPWKIVIKKNLFKVKLNKKRSGSFLDVKHYASFFAIGCFIENVKITAEKLGLTYTLEYPLYKNLEDTIACFIFTDRIKNSQSDLYDYISKRVSNRQLYDGNILENNMISSLEKSIQNVHKNYNIKTISDFEKKSEIAKILGTADRIRILHNDLFQQMIDEFRWSEEETNTKRDGMDLKTLELPSNVDRIFLLLKKFPFIRNIIPQEAFADMAKPLLLNCSHLACIATSRDLDYKSLLYGGMAMQKLWLTATKLGIALQPWSVSTFLLMRIEDFNGKGFSKEQILELEYMGKGIRKMFNLSKNEKPLLIFRLSKAKSPSARSLRIPWEQFTEIQS